MIPSGLHIEGAWMRGSDQNSGSLFAYVDLEQRVPTKHPLRVIRAIVNDVLAALDEEFEKLYEGTGRQSIAPERLLRASSLSRSITICCFAGSSASESTIPFGTTRPSRKTATVCWMPMLRASSWKLCCVTPK